jgi:hypothetical protein
VNQTQTTPNASNISTIADNKNDAVNHTARKSLLHIGCGPKSMHDLQGFSPVQWQEIRFDIDPNVRPDVLGSMTDLQAIDNASVDAVYSSHNLEHVYAHEVAYLWFPPGNGPRQSPHGTSHRIYPFGAFSIHFSRRLC